MTATVAELVLERNLQPANASMTTTADTAAITAGNVNLNFKPAGNNSEGQPQISIQNGDSKPIPFNLFAQQPANASNKNSITQAAKHSGLPLLRHKNFQELVSVDSTTPTAAFSDARCQQAQIELAFGPGSGR